MQIQSISVSAGRAFPSPINHREQYRFTLNLSAELHSTDDPDIAVVILQGQAEALADKHKQRLLDDVFSKPIDAVLPDEFFGAKVEPEKPKLKCILCETTERPLFQNKAGSWYCSLCNAGKADR
jgi:hypothetical protein